MSVPKLPLPVIKAKPAQTNPIIIVQMPQNLQQPKTTNTNTTPSSVPVPVTQHLPTIVSSQSLQPSALTTESSRTGTYFTFGKNVSEVAAIFHNFDAFLKSVVSPVSPNWFHGITGLLGSANPITLNIYELKSTSLGLSLPKSIQMFSDQTIRILVDSRDCTKTLLENQRIETPENLKQLIEKVNMTSLCAGLKDYGSVLVCRGGVKERKTWFSNQCKRIVSFDGNSSAAGNTPVYTKQICRDCRRLRKCFQQRVRRKEKKTGKGEDQDRNSSQFEDLLNVKKNTKVNVKVRDLIENRLQNMWTSLGLDEEVRKYKEGHRTSTNDNEFEEVDTEVGQMGEAVELQPETVEMQQESTEIMSEESEDLMDL